MNMEKVNIEIVKEILKTMPQTKKEQLKKALIRNFNLTSSYNLEDCTLTIYKEGFYLELNGARSSFKVFAKDDDGKLIITRKPQNISKLYFETKKMNESDFIKF